MLLTARTYSDFSLESDYMSKSKELSVAIEAIKRASEKLRMLFRKNIIATQKYGFDIRQVCSEADLQSEQILRTDFQNSFFL